MAELTARISIDASQLRRAFEEITSSSKAAASSVSEAFAKVGSPKIDTSSTTQAFSQMGGTAAKALDGIESEAREVSATVKIIGTTSEAAFGAMGKAAEKAVPANFADRLAKIGLVSNGIQSAAQSLEGLTQPFVELDAGLRAIGTLGVKNFEEFGDAALELSRTFPDNAAVISNAVADAVGSGLIKTNEAGKIAIEDAKAFAAQASSLAVGGATNIGTAVKGLGSVINAYGSSLDKMGGVSEKAAYVNDILFNTYNLGVVSVDELASSLSNVTGLAASAGVGIDQVGAAIATLTKQGGTGSMRVTQIRALIQELAAGKDKLAPVIAEVQNQFGKMEGVFKSTGKAYDKTKTLQDNLKAGNITLQDVTIGIGKAAKAQGKELTNIFGSIEAAQAVLGLSGEQAGQALEDLGNIGKRGTLAEGVAVQADSIENRMKVLVNTVNSAFIGMFRSVGNGATVAIGTLTKLAPTITAVTNIKQLIPESAFTAVGNGIKSVAGGVVGLAKDFSGTMASMRTGLAVVAGNIGQTILPAIARIAPALVTTSATGTLSFAGLGAAASAAWAAITGPVGLVVAGVAAVGAAIYLLYQNFEPFRNFVDNTWKGIVKAFNDAKPVLAELGKVFKDIGAFVMDTFVGALRGVFDIIRGVGSAIIGTLIFAFDKLSFVVKPIADIFGRIGEAARGFISSLFSTTSATQAASVGLQGFTGVLGSVRAGLVNIRAFIAGVAGGFEVLGATLSDIATKLINPAEWGKINLSGFFDNFQKAFTNRWNQVWTDAKAVAADGVKVPDAVDPKKKDDQISALEALQKTFAKVKKELADGADVTQVVRDLKALFREVDKNKKQGKISLIEGATLEREIEEMIAQLKKGSKAAKSGVKKDTDEAEKAFAEFLKKTAKLREELDAQVAKAAVETRIKALEDEKTLLEKNDLLAAEERVQRTREIELQILAERKKLSEQSLEAESNKRFDVIQQEMTALLDKTTKLSNKSILDFVNDTANLMPDKIQELLKGNSKLTNEQIAQIIARVKDARVAIDAQNQSIAQKSSQEFAIAQRNIEQAFAKNSIAARLQDELRLINLSLSNEQQRKAQTDLATLKSKYDNELLQVENAEKNKQAVIESYAERRRAIEANTALNDTERSTQLAALEALQEREIAGFVGMQNRKTELLRQFSAEQTRIQMEQFAATGTFAREQTTFMTQFYASAYNTLGTIQGQFAARSNDFSQQKIALARRKEEEMRTTRATGEERLAMQKRFKDEERKLELQYNSAGAFLAQIKSTGAAVLSDFAAQSRNSFQKAAASAQGFADLSTEAFAQLGISAGATIGSLIASGEGVGKALGRAAFDALQAVVPVIIAQITGFSLAQPDAVATFGASAVGRVAIITALVQGALSVARAAVGLEKGGLVHEADKVVLPGVRGVFYKRDEAGEEFVVNRTATVKNLSTLREINKRNITFEQHFVEKLKFEKDYLPKILAKAGVSLSSQTFAAIPTHTPTFNTRVVEYAEKTMQPPALVQELSLLRAEVVALKAETVESKNEIRKLNRDFRSHSTVDVRVKAADDFFTVQQRQRERQARG